MSPLIPLIAMLFNWATAPAARAGDPAPDWVHDRPFQPGYLVGIGVAGHDGDLGEARNRSLGHAMADLSMQLRARVQGAVTVRTRETDGRFVDEVESLSLSRSQATMEGVEIVATWMGDDQCWTFARLSLERLAAGHRQRQQHLDSLLGSLEVGDRGNALSMAAGLEALLLIDRLEASPGIPPQDDRRHRAQAGLAAALGSVELRASTPARALKRGPDLDAWVELSATRRGGAGPDRALAGLPLRLAFTRGAGAADSLVWTDASGRARARVHRVWGRDVRHRLTATVDLEALGRAHGYAAGQPPGMPVPATHLEFTVPRAPAHLTCDERNLGQAMAAPALATAALQALEEAGYEVTASPRADALRLAVRGWTHPGTCLNGVCFAYLDLGLRATQFATGDVVFDHSLASIKGAGTTMENAGLAALGKGALALTAALAAALTGRATDPATH